MSFRSRPVIAIVAVVALALAGGGAAFAVTKSHAKNQNKGSNSTQQQCGPGARGFFRQGGPGGPGGPGHVFGFFEGVSDYLGLTDEQIWNRIMNGQSLADIAKAQGKSVEGLKDAIVNAASERLQKAVDDGHLTEAQKNQILDDIRSHVDEIVNRSGPPMGHGGPPDFGRGGPPMGPPPWDRGGSNGNDNNDNNGGSSGNASFGPPAAGAWA